MRTINAISSKSDAHRALICSALSGGKCRVIYDTTSDDIEATIDCLTALFKNEKEMHCRESGSTFRFLLPVMGAIGYDAEFYPEGRLGERPLSPLYEEMVKHGCILSTPGAVPFKVSGQLTSGRYSIAGNVSSQYVSGLLFALPLLSGDSSIEIEGKLQSEAYVKMTINTLRRFGIEIVSYDGGFFVEGSQTYIGPESYRVEGDWSNAAFMLAAGAYTNDGLCVQGLKHDSLQGDKAVTEMLRRFGADVVEEENQVMVFGGRLHGTEIDAGQIPDMVPALAALAAAADGETRIYNAARLRLKESDRLHAIAEVINAAGGTVKELDDGLIIEGTGRLKGGEVSSFGDHRIAMMAAVLSLISDEKMIIRDSDAVKKSYPGFFEDMHKLSLDSNLERK